MPAAAPPAVLSTARALLTIFFLFLPLVGALSSAAADKLASPGALPSRLRAGGDILADAAEPVRRALTLDAAGGARGALARIRSESVAGGHVAAVLANPDFAPHAAEVALALEKIQNVKGVDRVLERLARAKGESIAGPAFEIVVGARLGNDLRELSADVDGHETDAILADGTLVEIKYGGAKAGKAGAQLEARTANSKRDVLLVTSARLGNQALVSFLNRFDGRGKVLVALPGEAGLRPQRPITAAHIRRLKEEGRARAAERKRNSHRRSSLARRGPPRSEATSPAGRKRAAVGRARAH